MPPEYTSTGRPIPTERSGRIFWPRYLRQDLLRESFGAKDGSMSKIDRDGGPVTGKREGYRQSCHIGRQLNTWLATTPRTAIPMQTPYVSTDQWEGD